MVMALTAIACERHKTEKQELRPGSVAYLNYYKNITKSESDQHLSPLEIVKRAGCIAYQAYNIELNQCEQAYAGLGETLQDTINIRIGFWADWIIDSKNHCINPIMMRGCDMVIIGVVADLDINDTIAYVPNQVMRECEHIIQKAFDEGDYNKAYKTVEEMYVFKPITGLEWRELKKQGVE